MEGWIKLHKKLLTWEWYRDSHTLHLFLHLLLKANYQPSLWRGRIIEQGQILTGRRLLSKQTGLSEQSIRTSLERLKSTREITSKSTNRFSIITLVKYKEYQINDKKSTSKSTSQTSASQPHLRSKEEKKEDIEQNPPSGKKPPDPRVKSFIDYISMSFKEKTGETMHIHHGKDGAIIKSLLQTYDLPKLQSLWNIFIVSTDLFTVKAGFTIGVFQSQINKLISQPPPQNDWRNNPKGVKP